MNDLGKKNVIFSQRKFLKSQLNTGSVLHSKTRND